MSSLEEQFTVMQQQLAAIQAQLNGATNPTPMQSADDTATPSLHSFGTRPHYDWSPSDSLMDLMELDVPLHTSKPLSDSERKSIIESYPPMAHVDYKAPITIPTAERIMNKGQKHEDNSLKQLQYHLSAAFRPLDILTHELFTYDTGNPNLERYSAMLRDIRRLLVHVCSLMTQQRNNIALRTINPAFSLKSDQETNYTLPLDEFQTTLIQQTAARKATREATANRRQHRRFTPGNSGSPSSFSTVSDQQFFRPGPPSQQGGFNNNFSNTNNNNNNNYNSNNNTFRQNNKNNNTNSKKTNNPFRQ